MQSSLRTISNLPSSYSVNEIFVSLQGEATFSGTPSIFIRLQGCEVGCGWCDTKNTWQLDKLKCITFTKMINKTTDNSSLAETKIEEIINFIQDKHSLISHIVITGGEPGQYNLQPLCSALEALGKQVQIETSGTSELRISAKTWVTLSPKIDMPGKKPILLSAVKRANEIKMPIGKTTDIDKLKQFIINYQPNSILPIWLQPISQNKTATQICIEQALKNNWKVSLQLHKYLNIR